MPSARIQDPDARLALILLRPWRGWSRQADLKAAGLSQSQVSEYERGERAVPREVLERVANAAGFPLDLLNPLLRNIGTFRAAGAGKTSLARSPRETMGVELLSFVRAAAAAVLAVHNSGRPVASGERVSPAESRQEAAALWARLQPRTLEERRLLVESAKEYRSWALCERVAAESLAMASKRPKESLQLALLALSIAERVPGEERWRWRLRGYVLAHIANALRACNDLPAANKAMAQARAFWEAGASSHPERLNAGCLPWLEGVLRRDQRQLAEALERSDEALALDRGELRGKILLSKANILKVLGDPE